MQPTDVLILATALLVYAFVSRRAERGIVTPPMVFAALGFFIGAEGLGLVDLTVEDTIIHDLAEITLVLTLFTDASRIDVTELDKRHAVPLRLLAIGLPLAMAAGMGAAWLLFPALGLWGATVLGVILSPTDAALGQAVLSNGSLPQRIRQALNVESGLNDGLAFPVLLIAASFAAEGHDRGAGEWLGFVSAQLVLGPLAGIAVGWVAGWLCEHALEREWMGEVYLRLASLATPLVAYGLAEVASGNGFIAAFACGLVVAARTTRLRGAAGAFGEAEGQLLTLTVFVLFGAVLLPDLAGLDWRHALYAVLSLTVLRMVPIALSVAGMGFRPSTILFLGWFGPRGLASVIYLLLILEEYEIAGLDDIRLTVLITVALSIIAHGVSAAPLARLYGRIANDDTKDAHGPHAFALRFDLHRRDDGTRPTRGNGDPL